MSDFEEWWAEVGRANCGAGNCTHKGTAEDGWNAAVGKIVEFLKRDGSGIQAYFVSRFLTQQEPEKKVHHEVVQ